MKIELKSELLAHLNRFIVYFIFEYKPKLLETNQKTILFKFIRPPKYTPKLKENTKFCRNE